MIDLLWVVVLVPFMGALILALFGASMLKKAVGVVGCTTIGISWIMAMIVCIHYIAVNPASGITTILYNWFDTGGFRVDISLHLDALSVVMILVITFVAFLIHFYSSQSMYDEDGYSRFFCYMNLFVGSMLTLVLANNLLLLYLGWEGVGLCSYLLIGFWYKDADNGKAAQKAFIVTRVGDTALAIGLFLLFKQFGTLNIHGLSGILSRAPVVLSAGGAIVTAISALILGGAVGKSAQLPLQTWLPDAMAGPTPVSALIHAATMVTAGVYLIARMHVLFMMAPAVMLAVAIIGTLTLFYSGFSALVQRDIKRVLAYSTISQIGYMFLALGVGAWTAAIFHFLTHAFFKALLFLSAGVAIDALDDEHDLFKMGGLRRQLPIASWTFLIGAASLSALPIITAGFFSKDAIIWAAYSSRFSMTWLWVTALLSAFITAVYSFRAWYLAFAGNERHEITKYPGVLMDISLILLAFFSITAGYISWPEVLLKFNPLGVFLSRVFPPVSHGAIHLNRTAEGALLGISAALCFLGILTVYEYRRHARWVWVVERSPIARAVHSFFYNGWGFDRLYDYLFVRPYRAIAYANRQDFIDWFYKGLAELARAGNTALSYSQTGRVRNYAAGLVFGAVIVAAIVLLR